MLAAFLMFSLIQLSFQKNISFDIMGGQLVEISKFPHAVALFIESNDDPNAGRGCGASVLNQEVLLTCATCMINTTRTKVEAYTGNEYMWDGTRSLIRRIVKHPNFSEQRFVADLALLRLRQPLTLGKNVGRVVLVRTPRRWAEEIAGFGSSGKGKQNYLKFVQQRIIHRRACLNYVHHLPHGTFCARHPSGYPAFDDAGSALVQRRIVQSGVLSFENVPDAAFAIYSNVSYYYDWITSNMRDMRCVVKEPESNLEDNSKDYIDENNDDAPEHTTKDNTQNNLQYSSDYGDKISYEQSLDYTVELTEHGWDEYEKESNL